MMRLALDGTPLLGPRSGVGEVVSGIASELARRPGVEVVAYGLTLRGRKDLAAVVPPGVRAASRTFPARLVRQSWLRGGVATGRTLDRTDRRRARDQLRGTPDEGR